MWEAFCVLLWGLVEASPLPQHTLITHLYIGFSSFSVTLPTPSALLPQATPQLNAWGLVLVSSSTSRETQMMIPRTPSFYLFKELLPFSSSLPEVSNICAGRGFGICFDFLFPVKRDQFSCWYPNGDLNVHLGRGPWIPRSFLGVIPLHSLVLSASSWGFIEWPITSTVGEFQITWEYKAWKDTRVVILLTNGLWRNRKIGSVYSLVTFKIIHSPGKPGLLHEDWR